MARKASPPPTVLAQGSQNPSDPRGAKVAPGLIRLWTRDGDIDLLCLQGTEPPQPTRGYGGWVSSGRQGRRAKSSYPGVDTPAVDVTLMIEESAVRSTTVERKRALLEAIAGTEYGTSDADTAPPPVLWVGNHWTDSAHRVRGALWVCENLDWTSQTYDDAAQLLRAEAKLSLGWYDPAQLPQLARATGFRRVTLKAGESLRTFAHRVLGDSKRWKDVATLNRTNQRCPSSPEFKVTRDVQLQVPPRDR